VHAYEVYPHEMHARKVYTHEMYARKVYTHETPAHLLLWWLSGLNSGRFMCQYLSFKKRVFALVAGGPYCPPHLLHSHPAQIPTFWRLHTPPSTRCRMDYEERMTAAFAALDLQETRNYSQVTKKYKLERTTLVKRYKGQTVSRKVYQSESRQCLTEAQEEALIK
jgi:hypothetical protein